MNRKVESIINQYAPYIILSLAVITLLLFVIVIMLFKKVDKVDSRYRKMMRGVNGNNLEEVVTNYMNNIDKASKRAKKALDENKILQEQIVGCVQKVAIVRYKAFEDVGSYLSFSIAILDGEDNGIILTGIYGRQESTTYAKPIDRGISRYDLSEEEITVLNNAINKNRINNKN